jgi:putative redox protein
MPTVSLSLDWTGDLSFRNSPGSPAIELHSGIRGATSPPHALAYAVMACMAMDIVDIIRKGRHDLRAMTVRFEGVRAETHPRRFLSMDLRFDITGLVPDAAVARAIDLSRDRYCSVWNTIRPDVALTTSFTVGA